MSQQQFTRKSNSSRFHIKTPRVVKQSNRYQRPPKSPVKSAHISSQLENLTNFLGKIPYYTEYNKNVGFIQNKKSTYDSETQKMSNWSLGKIMNQSQSAVIYKAIHKNIGMMVAVKKIIYDEKDKEDHKKQLEVLCKINHNNVVKYMFHHQSKNQTFIFMEYVPTTLKNFVECYGTLPLQNYLCFAKQIINGLDYLHRQKIVHKDIKCSNILLDNDAVVKIADFGCSKSFDQTLSFVNYQSEGCRTFKGSILWMAPQVFYDNIYNRKTDIWSLGCTLLELATGKSPWHEKKFDNQLSAVHIIAKEGQLPLIPENIHPEIQSLISKCIQRNPNQRWLTSQLLLYLG